MKVIRSLRFRPRSTLPVSAACVVANGIRETLAQLLGTTVSVRLLEPRLPDASAWRAIVSGARIYRVRGSVAEVALLLRAGDALMLAGAAFGETVSSARELSQVEAMVLERIVAALDLSPVCGTPIEPARPATTLLGFSTYFEVALEEPVRVRFGVAVARDPVPQPVGKLRVEDLSEVELDVCVRAGRATVTAGVLAGLQIGSIVPITHDKRLTGAVYLAGSLLQGGECGVRGGRYALSIGRATAAEGATN